MRETKLQPAPALWLLLGASLTFLAHLRFGVGVLGWIAAAPFAVYLLRTSGWRSRALLGVVATLTWTVTVTKIITDPIPMVVAIGFGLPIAGMQLAGLLAWDRLRRYTPQLLSPLLFATSMALQEWAQATFTPLASWGAVGYTQVDNPPAMQLASMFGLFGLGFTMHYCAGALAELVAGRRERARTTAIAAAAVFVTVHAAGAGRLAFAARAAQPSVAVAAVGTDSTIGGLPLPSRAEIAAVERGLFERTRLAAAQGAQLVVWTEAANMAFPGDEDELLARLSELAREQEIELVAAYVVPTQLEPLRYENKYAWLRPDGSLDHTYLKHRPVPGEPAIAGSAPPEVVDTAVGRASGAICYDFDFPQVARAIARVGVDLVALPSSDWRGIDPIHTQMAAFRAVEQGFSVLRSTRWGLSAAIDPHGRARGWQSAFDSEQRVLVAELPRHGVRTLYGVIGDSWMLAPILVLLLRSVRVRRRAAARFASSSAVGAR